MLVYFFMHASSGMKWSRETSIAFPVAGKSTVVKARFVFFPPAPCCISSFLLWASCLGKLWCRCWWACILVIKSQFGNAYEAVLRFFCLFVSAGRCLPWKAPRRQVLPMCLETPLLGDFQLVAGLEKHVNRLKVWPGRIWDIFGLWAWDSHICDMMQ